MSDPVLALLDLYGGEAASGSYDESVTEVAHALQCADLAIAESAPDALVAAALLHDVGHLLATGSASRGTAADDNHEDAGARYLRAWFGPEVTAPVALHVAAKRYLCATEPTVEDLLSPGSVRSLALQGGPMGDVEVAAFRCRPHWQDAVRLRRWDDAAKVPGAETRPLSAHEDLLRGLAMSSPVPRRRTRQATTHDH